MIPAVETAAAGVKLAWSFGTAGVAAFGAIGSRLLADSFPPGSERLLDLGFAGIFIMALLWALKIVWQSRANDISNLVQKLDMKDARIAALEKEMRDGLRQDLQEATASRREMIHLMKQGGKGGD